MSCCCIAPCHVGRMYAEKKAYMAADVMSQVKADRLVQKADNLVILYDKSDSMNTVYNNAPRLNLAKDITVQLVQTIPPISS